ncbi:MAG: hypothetical protein JSS90_03410 [Bacteroidetes bacterium]|jgi:hypothetical protein|nr:hypothetical protein [Bacteroidota bacterium]
MKETLFGLLAISSNTLTSCEKEEITKTTTANIKQTSATSTVSRITFYTNDQDARNIHGDNKSFATGQPTSNSDGIVVFSKMDYPTVFNSINNSQNNFRFSTHYSVNGIYKTKVK